MGKVTKSIREKPLTDVNLAIVSRTILAATSIIPARAAKELLKVVPSRYLSFFSKFPFVFFFQKSWQCSQCFHLKSAVD